MAKFLIELGANVNIYSTYDGESAIILACKDKDVDVKIVNDLLDHGANVNDIEQGKRRKDNSTRNTPLMAASRNGNLPLVTYLISKGADVNYKNEFSRSALIEALLMENYNVVLYLLENGADISQTIFNRPDEKRNLGILDVLREDFFELDSQKYNYKQQIIKFLDSKGLHYSNTPIPEYIIEKAKEKYPKDWQEYLKKY